MYSNLQDVDDKEAQLSFLSNPQRAPQLQYDMSRLDQL
jgi:hypothetical protein